MILELEVNSSAVRSSTTARCSHLNHWLRAVPRRTNAARAGVDSGTRDAEADRQIYGLPEKAPRCWCRHARHSRGMFRGSSEGPW